VRNTFLKNGNKLWRWQHQATSSKQPNKIYIKKKRKKITNDKSNNHKDQIRIMLVMSPTMFEGENKEEEEF
jgi:hypothetical protein